jgi:hypothetical protein
MIDSGAAGKLAHQLVAVVAILLVPVFWSL